MFVANLWVKLAFEILCPKMFVADLWVKLAFDILCPIKPSRPPGYVGGPSLSPGRLLRSYDLGHRRTHTHAVVGPALSHSLARPSLGLWCKLAGETPPLGGVSVTRRLHRLGGSCPVRVSGVFGSAVRALIGRFADASRPSCS